jgi:uncharacterized protein (TIGR00297 family)
MDWIIGFVCSTCIASLAYWKRSLSASGMLAAIVVGMLFYALGSIAWFGTLIAFFISSSLLSKWKQRVKREAESIYHKSGRRDAGQVIANGGIGLLLCAIHAWSPQPIFWYAFLGVMATVNADTWATEIGGLSKNDPISIISGARVAKGTSGAISALGMIATILGALFIGFVAWFFMIVGDLREYIEVASTNGGLFFLACLVSAGVAGVIGSLVDSLFGATIQTMYRCSVCGKEVERTQHCNSQTTWIRGIRGMSNDLVNMISSIIGGLVGAVLAVVLLH